jgi:predicted AAA+ superfamily ATPase
MSEFPNLESLVIFRNLLNDPIIGKFADLLEDSGTDERMFVRHYAAFAADLFTHTDNLTCYILEKTLEDDNCYVRLIAGGKPVPETIKDAVSRELRLLETAGSITASVLGKNSDMYLPEWTNAPVNFAEHYAERMRDLGKRGYGIYASHHMFVLRENRITPLRHPDPQNLSELYGYKAERGIVEANTQALLAGKPAANVLLYGDAGTGKSATVKAIANAYARDGLRLIEIRKEEMHLLPEIIEELAENPLKFILFMDDLSFPEEDSDFAVLKAVLEGGAAARTANIAVYATSNRRHLVRESFSARKGDEVHLADTLEETASLAARFGLVVTFLRPDRETYLNIVASLADEYHLNIPEDELFSRAECFALKHSGRTPRAARQFIGMLGSEYLNQQLFCSGQPIPTDPYREN